MEDVEKFLLFELFNAFRIPAYLLQQEKRTVNINQTWPSPDEKFPLNTTTLYDFLSSRRSIYVGFASIEKNRGVLEPEVNLNTSRGQEMLRVLMFRVIEECTESLAADDSMHMKEEVIDAINYLWSILIIDPHFSNLNRLANSLYELYTDPAVATRYTSAPSNRSGIRLWDNLYYSSLTHEDVGQIAEWLAGDVGDLLRNRAWMNNSQSIYFEGANVLELSILRVTDRLMKVFTNWDEFARFYVAKARVLEFRLRTNY